MRQIYTNSFIPSNITFILCASTTEKVKLVAEEKENNLWDVYAVNDELKEKTHKNLTTSAMADYLLLFEEEKKLQYKPSLDFNDLAETDANPDYVVNFFQDLVKKGEYSPALMVTKHLGKAKEFQADMVIKIDDGNLLNKIKEDQLSVLEKLAKRPELAYVIARKQHDDSWQLATLDGWSPSPIAENISAEHAREFMFKIETLRGKNFSSGVYMPHCHHSKFNQYPAKKASAMTPAAQGNMQDITFKGIGLTQGLGGTTFNLN